MGKHCVNTDKLALNAELCIPLRDAYENSSELLRTLEANYFSQILINKTQINFDFCEFL